MLIVPALVVEVKPASITPAPSLRVMSDSEFSSWALAKLAETECDDYRPTAGPDFTPTPEQAAEDFGYSLGYGGIIEALPPDGLDPDGLTAFVAGFARGVADLEAERDTLLERLAAEHDAMEEAFGDPEMTRHPAELAGAGDFARDADGRRGGGW